MEASDAQSIAPEKFERQDIFSDIPLFATSITGSKESGDCSCFSCDGNPCVKLVN